MDHSHALMLDTTGEFLGGPILGAHDNSCADGPLLALCMDCLELVGCN